MSFSLADVAALHDVTSKVETNPISLAGRFLGLTPEEQKAGVPAWAWVGLGVTAGAIGAYLLAKRFGGHDFLRKT